MIIFFLVLFLPLLEIAGFIIIGGKIGVGWSLLWVIVATMMGFYFLTTMGTQTLQKAKQSVEADVYPFEEMFEGLCILLGALLLIFPGFISDFMALPLLIAPVRRWIFRFLKYQHESLFNDLSKGTRGFTYWYYEERKSPGATTIIEGDFKQLDDDKKLPGE
ncbi:MAG: FxsA family protein [Proteobacteria bacterium]|nr:FxsA family protein [Pseudomonadota bacterium]